MQALTSFTKTSARFREKVLLQRFAEVAKRRTAFSFPRFQVPKFSFSEKRDVSSFRSNGKGPGLFSPREYSALFSELFVRAHARRRHRAVFRLTKKGTFENGNLLSLKAENGIYKFPKS